MNAGEYTALCKVFKAVASRELQYHNSIESLLAAGDGCSTGYQVNV
jgi:hypothetical protein